MIRRSTTLRGRLTLWYTAVLTAMLLLLGTISLLLLDYGLRKNVDDSLLSLARTIAESSRPASIVNPDLEDSLDALLGPELAQRFFQLLDPFGRLDPRMTPRTSRLPLSVAALRNAARGQATLETVQLPTASEKPFRLLTFPVVRDGATVNIVQVAMSLD